MGARAHAADGVSGIHEFGPDVYRFPRLPPLPWFAVAALLIGIALATAGTAVLIRAVVQHPGLPGDSAQGILFSVVTLAILMAASLLLAAVAWWLVLRLHESRRQLQELAHRDPLTGLYNRRYFHELYLAEAQRARSASVPFSVAMLDVDGFKDLNDSQGHAVGDAVLVSLADILMSSVRSVDVVARYGGDEFVILMPRTDAEQAESALGRLEQHLAKWRREAVSGTLGVSIGASTSDGHSDVLSQADRVMYEIKKVARRNA